jgi:hypothetical protein
MISNTGPRLPDNAIQDNDVFGRGLQTNLWQATQAALGDSIAGSMFSLGAFAKKEYLQQFDPGKTLTNEEWKESEYYRPGLDIKGDISENVAKLEAQRHDQKQMYSSIISGVPSGAISSLSVNGIGLIGMALNPEVYGGAKAAEFVMGKVTPTLLGMLEESNLAGKAYKAARTGINVAHGAAVGGIAFMPDVASRYVSDDALDQNPSGIEAITSIAMGAGLGGVLHGLFGDRLPITRDSFNTMRETAAGQVANGKSVHLDEIAQDGYRRQRIIEEAQTPEQAAFLAEKERLEAKTNKLEKNLEEAKKAEAKAKRSMTETPEQIISAEKATNEVFKNTKEKHLKNVIKKWSKGEELSDREKFVFDKEWERQRKTGERPPIEHHSEIDKSLADKRLYDELRNKEEAPDEKKYKKTKRKLEKQKAKLSEEDIKSKWERGKYWSDREKYEFAHHSRIEAQKTLDAHLENITNHEANEAINRTPGEPVSTDALKQSADKVNSVEGDHTVNANEISNFNREMESLPKTHEEALSIEEEKIKRLDDSGHLDEGAKAELEDIKDIPKNQAMFEDLVRKAANCLKGSD